MPPVTTAVGKHAGEIAHGRYAWPRKAGTGIGIGPTVAPVRGSEDEIRIVVRKTAAAFIHPGDVHVACSQVAGDLDVADKWGAARDLSSIRPGNTVIGLVTNEESSAANIKVVLGSVHPAVERRRWVVIRPTRFSIVLGVSVNAVMCPAIRVSRSGSLIPSKALAAAAAVEPNGKPSPRWAVVQDNGVANRIGKWTLAVSAGEASEGSAAVG